MTTFWKLGGAVICTCSLDATNCVMCSESVKMRTHIETLDGKLFDVLVVGAGVNGSSAVESLAAAGYTTLLVDKGDFGSGASSKASRLAHCGLIYLAPIKSAWEYVFDPRKLVRALNLASPMMKARAEFVDRVPSRMRPLDFYYPIYDDTPYSPWQARIGFRLLSAFGPKHVPLHQEMVKPRNVAQNPLLASLKDYSRIKSFAKFREYQFNWQERLCVDAVLNAEKMGATTLNYCEVTKARQDASGDWVVELTDNLGGAKIEVRARALVNTAGPWIDTVNSRFDRPVEKCVTVTKGVHMMVRLPPECANMGVVTSNEIQGMFMAIPWRDGLHYLGPTETEHKGDATDVVPTEHDIELLLRSCGAMFPGLQLKRKDVVFAWAGLRPLTYDPKYPPGRRDRKLHNIGGAKGKGVALSWGRLIDHRSAGPLIASNLLKTLKPKGAAQQVSFSSRASAVSGTLEHGVTPEILAELQHAARNEHVTSLPDLLLRRSNIGFSDRLSEDDVRQIANGVATEMHWDDRRVEQEVADYKIYMKRHHLVGA